MSPAEWKELSNLRRLLTHPASGISKPRASRASGSILHPVLSKKVPKTNSCSKNEHTISVISRGVSSAGDNAIATGYWTTLSKGSLYSQGVCSNPRSPCRTLKLFCHSGCYLDAKPPGESSLALAIFPALWIRGGSIQYPNYTGLTRREFWFFPSEKFPRAKQARHLHLLPTQPGCHPEVMIHGHPLRRGWEKVDCHGSWLLDRPTFSQGKFSRSGKVDWWVFFFWFVVGCFFFYLPVWVVRKELLLTSSALLCPSEAPGALPVWLSRGKN